ncbi:MAG: hypothetical protein ACNI3A_11635 [Desulfovibrio sp.]|uniref:hypothetical protein n=1 Tax=Desulfovibrio sp. 7SRBS1 TaxID=3378064 RepID=UPI003B3F126A
MDGLGITKETGLPYQFWTAAWLHGAATTADHHTNGMVFEASDVSGEHGSSSTSASLHTTGG